MPHVVNGIGTWYWGKRNLTVRRSQCSHCGHTADLKSYDTTLFFVILFIPIFPLGARRILNDCPRCMRHSAAKLAEFERARAEAVGGAALALKGDPENPEKAIRAVVATVQYDARQEFLGLAQLFGPGLRSNFDFLYCLAASCEHFGFITQAHDNYEAAYALNPTEGISRDFGVSLLRHTSADAGLVHLQPILDRADPNDTGLMYLVVEALQAEGRHAEARELLQSFAEKNPAISDSKEYKKYLKLATKHEHDSRKIKSALINPGEVKQSERAWAFSGARLIPLAVAIIALGAYFFTAFSLGRDRKVWLVNSRKDLSITINGRQFKALAARPVEIHITEGPVAVKVTDPAGIIEDQTGIIETNFWLRPFTSHTFVINPDRLDILSLQEVHYSASKSSAPRPEPKSSYFTNSLVHHFTSVDYAFTAPPASIKQAKSGRTVTKQHLDVLPADSAFIQYTIADLINAGAAFEHAKRCIALDPKNEPAYHALLAFADKNDALAPIRPILARRPVVTEAHRAYQHSLTTDPSHDLVAEYRALLQASPDNRSLRYLLARIVPTFTEAESLYLGALDGPEPEQFAEFALPSLYLSAGLFDRALAAASSALAHHAGDAYLQCIAADSLAALGKLEEALSRPEFAQSTPDTPSGINLRKVWMLAALGRANESRLAASQVLQGSDSIADRAFFNFTIAYASGDATVAASALAAQPEPTLRYLRAMCQADADAASQALTASDNSESASAGEPWPHLQLYLLAKSQNKTELAARHLEAARNSLADTAFGGAAAATWLAGDQTPDAAQLDRLQFEPTEKAVLLAALATNRPELRDLAMPRAKALNFDRRFPYLLLRSVTGD